MQPQFSQTAQVRKDMRTTAAAPDRPGRRQWRTLGALAAFWMLSDLGYYFLLPAFGIASDYNRHPIAIATYYLFWVGLAAIAFWPLYARWNAEGPWPTVRNRMLASLVWIGLYAGMILFLAVVLPWLPQSVWPAEAGPPPDIVVAGPSYFLPKTVEILFQQALVMALIVSLSIDETRLRVIAMACAALFGATHLLLFFSGIPPIAVLRFVVASTAFGLLLPWLILKTRFGLASAVALHWSYYAVTVAQIRLFGPAVVQSVLSGGQVAP